MYVTIRQGIIKAPTNFLVYQSGVVAINTMDAGITITASHGDAEYLITEDRKTSITPAWIQIFSPLETYWLFWDINTRTAQITYTSTTVVPVYQKTTPITPILNTHWFNTNDNTMRVWDGFAWIEKIRVLAGILANTTTLTLAIAGVSQSGNNTPRNSGSILFDSTSTPIKRNLKTFLTTEDTIFYDSNNISATNIEAKTVWAQVIENINAFSVVSTLSDGTLKLASAEDIGISNIAMAMDSATLGDHVSVTLQGKITNPDWNWTQINQLLWLDINGQLTVTDPNTLNPIRPSRSPIARVISIDSIIFMPGLIASSSQVNNIIGLASTIRFGATKLSVDAILPINPIVVGNNDPRMTNARVALPHVHTALSIPTTAHNSLIASDVQSVLNSLYDTKIDSSGGTISGILSILQTPTSPYHAVNKQYVDNASSGFMFVDPVVAASTTHIPVLAGLTTIDGIELSANDRVLIKNQNNNIKNGIYTASVSAWTRTTDTDEVLEVHTGLYVFVQSGSINSQTGWVLTTPNPIIPDESSMIFVQFNGLGQITVGNGLLKTGNSISAITVTNSRLVSTLSGLDLVTTGVVPSTYNNVVVDLYGRVTSGNNVSYLTDNNIVTYTGDVTGTGNAIVELTLSSVGTPGTYTSVTTDINGRVISGSNPSSGVTPGTYNTVTVNDTGLVILAENTIYLTDNQQITLSGDITGSGTVNIETTLSNNGVMPGTYRIVTVDATGRVTSGDTGATGITPGTYNSLTINDWGNATAGTQEPYITDVTLSGDVTGAGAGSVTTTLSNTGVTANTYGSSMSVPVITVDAKGRITGLTTTVISGNPGGIYTNIIGDSNFSSVTLLLHGDGTNGSTTFTDSSLLNKTITRSGNAQISTTNSKFGGASILFDGGGDYLNIPTSADFAFGTGDFTIESWLYPVFPPNGYPICIYTNQQPMDVGLSIAQYGNNNIYINVAGSYINSGPNTLPDNTWTHFALTRSGTNLRLFINGTQVATTVTNSTNVTCAPNYPTIGGNSSGWDYKGYMDDFRVTKGIARYTSNFTAPTAAFSNVAVIGTLTSIQFNNNGVLGGSSSFIWDNTNNYLGVNKSTPTQALDVVGNITATGTLVLGTPLATTQGGTGLSTLGTGLQVLRTNTGATGLEWATVSSGSISVTNDTTTNNTCYPTFSTTTSGVVTTLEVSDTQLTFNPSTGTLFATNMATSSDKTLKENIVTIINGLDIINQIEPRQFNWKRTGEVGYGVVAQEIENLLPELVYEGSEYKSVNYNYIVGFLISAVKDLSQQVENSSAKIEYLLSQLPK